MRPHVSINVSDVEKSVDSYKRVFGMDPQKKTVSYAKFDLPILNFTMQSGEERMISQVNHLGIEVSSTDEETVWESRLIQAGILDTPFDKPKNSEKKCC